MKLTTKQAAALLNEAASTRTLTKDELTAVGLVIVSSEGTADSLAHYPELVRAVVAYASGNDSIASMNHVTFNNNGTLHSLPYVNDVAMAEEATTLVQLLAGQSINLVNEMKESATLAGLTLGMQFALTSALYVGIRTLLVGDITGLMAVHELPMFSKYDADTNPETASLSLTVTVATTTKYFGRKQNVEVLTNAKVFPRVKTLEEAGHKVTMKVISATKFELSWYDLSDGLETYVSKVKEEDTVVGFGSANLYSRSEKRESINKYVARAMSHLGYIILSGEGRTVETKCTSRNNATLTKAINEYNGGVMKIEKIYLKQMVTRFSTQ